jgi:hypothetical protein
MQELYSEQKSLFPDETEDQPTPAQKWSEEAAKHSLDELFNATLRYRSSQAFMDLLNFVSRFKFYSPFNALLIHAQRPGSRFVATPARWDRNYGRTINVSANPIVILKPKGPVMFVFDVSDTEPGPNAKKLPRQVENPFEALEGKIGQQLEMTLSNVCRDGIRIQYQETGNQRGGSIQPVRNTNQEPLRYHYGNMRRKEPKWIEVLVRYEVLISQDLDREARYATLAHELAHLYCGHLGTPNRKWWPDRSGLDKNTVEFEAESTAYIVCGRQGIRTPAEAYLNGYLDQHDKIPDISLECVMKAAGLIDDMGEKPLKPRKGDKIETA